MEKHWRRLKDSGIKISCFPASLTIGEGLAGCINYQITKEFLLKTRVIKY